MTWVYRAEKYDNGLTTGKFEVGYWLSYDVYHTASFKVTELHDNFQEARKAVSFLNGGKESWTTGQYVVDREQENTPLDHGQTENQPS